MLPSLSGVSGRSAGVSAHTHPASEVVSGTFDDARISESSVTQHEAAIDHNALLNFLVAEHRKILDSGTSTIDLFSASKILTLIGAVSSGIDVKDPVETVADVDITLSGEQTINGVTTSASRIAVIGQTDDTENGYYLTAAGAWSRTTDADEDAEVTNGMTTIVLNSASTFYRHKIILSTADPITLGVTPLSFINIPALDFGTTAGTATEGNDSRVLTQDENNAAVGTDGVASSGNKYVTNSDPRNTDNRTDAVAIHDNVAGEIVAVDEKGSPVAADLVLIEDSEDSNSKKRVQIGNFPGSGGGLGYVLDWGAQMAGGDTGKFARSDGNPAASVVSVLDPESERTVPFAGNLDVFAWNTESATGSTVMKILKNQVVVQTKTLTGATGTISLSGAVVAGDQLAVEFDAGTGPDKSNFTIGIV